MEKRFLFPCILLLSIITLLFLLDPVSTTTVDSHPHSHDPPISRQSTLTSTASPPPQRPQPPLLPPYRLPPDPQQPNIPSPSPSSPASPYPLPPQHHAYPTRGTRRHRSLNLNNPIPNQLFNITVPIMANITAPAAAASGFSLLTNWILTIVGTVVILILGMISRWTNLITVLGNWFGMGFIAALVSEWRAQRSAAHASRAATVSQNPVREGSPDTVIGGERERATSVQQTHSTVPVQKTPTDSVQQQTAIIPPVQVKVQD
ncbi:hypothetical protein Droror1_Dr00016925 [Drosera rotundifolia]